VVNPGEVPRSIETRNKLPDCAGPGWKETNNETVLVASGGTRPRKEALFGGARLTIEIGAQSRY
jgi:hypothetical protein